MREIRFRGRSTTSSRFVYGDLIQNKDGCVINCDFGHDFAVESRTIGQYTGLKDRYDKKIYEGDIVDVVVFLEIDGYRKSTDARGVVNFNHGSFYIDCDGLVLYRWMEYEVSVIGNIHENPELLEQDNE